VVLDSCTDETRSIVLAEPDTETVSTTARQVGTARALGAEHLLRTTPASRQELWLANTDADSSVPIDWLSTMVAESDAGAHVLLGTVLPELDHNRMIERAWHDRHVLRDGHPHIHGANFGLRADTYLAMGGWAAISTGEDVQLAARAASTGHVHVTRTARIPVRTSARLTGRAPHGFSAFMAALHAEHKTLAPSA